MNVGGMPSGSDKRRRSSRSSNAPTGSGDDALQRFREATGGRGGRRHEYARDPRSGPSPREFDPRFAVPRRQKLLVGALWLWFGITAFWFRGGWEWEGHTTSLLLGIATFLLLFVSVDPKENPDASTAPRANLRRLLRFPMFWIGLYVLCYCGIQIWNISWHYEFLGGGKARLTNQPHIEWLPSTGRGPLNAEGNLYNGLLQIMVPWLMVCVVWTGIQSRRAWQALGLGVVGIMVAWSLVALWFYYSGSDGYFGIYMGRGNQPPFWGSIVNPNHGAFLQVLATFLCLAFAFVFWQRAVVGRSRFAPGFFLVALALFFSLATFQSASRGSIVLTAVGWIVFALIGVGWGIVKKAKPVSFGVAGLSLGALLALVVMILFTLEGGRHRALVGAWKSSLAQWETQGDVNRHMLNQVALRYADTYAPFGSGLATWGYRYRTITTPEESRIMRIRRGWQRDPETRKVLRDPETNKPIPRYVTFQFWHAHNDWLQALCELGWVGASGLYLLLAWPFLVALRFIHRTSLTTWFLLGGVFAMGLGSVYEFPLRTPVVGLLTALLMGLALGEISRRRERQAASSLEDGR
jgi:O-antigen ligase